MIAVSVEQYVFINEDTEHMESLKWYIEQEYQTFAGSHFGNSGFFIISV